ncbi:hypothetical protein B0H63DRAFT_162902 [Podospora didyma]|uniref:Uncharacterized protein n=1 Tax=Podospora didyma TaxID=330526 RepID=A0AAE0NU30_9PEZI|nr:hypothetical protein B0H63DRAFT_162902 [Podospora didyma]
MVTSKAYIPRSSEQSTRHTEQLVELDAIRTDIQLAADDIMQTCASGDVEIIHAVRDSVSRVVASIGCDMSTIEKSHPSLRQEIRQVYVAVQNLNRQIRTRDEELQQCLREIRTAQDVAKRKRLSERGNARTAGLMALAVCCESLKEILRSLLECATRALKTNRQWTSLKLQPLERQEEDDMILLETLASMPISPVTTTSSAASVWSTRSK